MRLKTTLLTLALALLAVTLVASPALAASPAPQDATVQPPQPLAGVITGTVTNGTTGVPVANRIVTLSISDARSLLEERSATTDSAGDYHFDKLPTDPTLAYVARAEYPAGLPYSTDPASFTSDTKALDLPIRVYETTTDGAGVSVERVHYIIELEPGRALIAELFLFNNDGDRTYIGDANGVLRFTLPPGYQDLSFNDGALGERYTATEDGFVDGWPLMPGQAVRQVLYRYTLPYSGKTLDLTRTIPYPAANVNALIADQGQRITSEQLANQGVRQTPNGNYISLLGQNLAANQTIAIRMTGLPDASGAVPASQPSASRILTYVLVGAAGAAVVLLALWPLLRKRVALQTAEAAPDDRESILDALARLTVAHEAGEVSDSAFQRESLRLKAQLRDLTDTQRTR